MFRQADDERGITTLKGGGGMWRLKFYKAYAKDKRLKRMIAYWSKYSNPVY